MSDTLNESEIETLHRGAVGAGLFVSVSDRGFFDTFKEAGALAKHVAAARGSSESAVVRLVAEKHGTGFGVTGPACPSGGLGPAGDANLVLPVQIYVGATQAETLFAGTRSGTLCGVVEFDVRIPDSLSKAGPVSVNYSMRDDLGFSESSSVYGVIFVK